MSEPILDDITKMHLRFAVQQFNRAWELIDKGGDRTPDEDAEMLAAAFSSRFHWQEAGGGPEQVMTAEWQIAHVASWLGHGSLAQTFAARAFAIVEREGWGDWQRASMLEGMARAAAAAGDAAGRARYHAEATAAIAQIEEDEERDLIAAQLATVPEV